LDSDEILLKIYISYLNCKIDNNLLDFGSKIAFI